MEQIGASLGRYIERVNMKREEFTDFIRVHVMVDVTKELKRGTYLRLGDGSKKWVAVTYERMALYCFLCGMVGHLEKKCPIRFAENFADPGTDLPFGDWLKASTGGEGSGNGRLPLQPIPIPNQQPRLPSTRGLQVFGMRTTSKRRENMSSLGGGGILSSDSIASSSSSIMRKRKVVTPSAVKNRRDGLVAQIQESEVRPSKKIQIGDMVNFVDVLVAPAMQPHHSK